MIKDNQEANTALLGTTDNDMLWESAMIGNPHL